MTTAKQLIDYLKSIPEDTLIEVIRTEYTLGNTTITSFVPLDLTEYSDNLLLCDYTKDIGSIYVGKFVLFLGDD